MTAAVSRLLTIAAGLSLSLSLGCGHVRTVQTGEKKGAEKSEEEGQDDRKGPGDDRAGKGGSEANDKDAKAGDDRDDRESKKRKETEQGVPFASSPTSLFKPGAERKIQDKLAEKDLLKSDKRGTFDPATREALRRFQDVNDLPATGIPDYATTRKLGLDPDEIFISKTADGNSEDGAR